jgi:hypothetical protein
MTGCLFSPAGLFPQELEPSGAEAGSPGPDSALLQSRTIPEALLRPQRGEAPRFPQDVVIGELGQGNAQMGAYLFARTLLAALLAENRDSNPLSSLDGDFLEDVLNTLKTILPRSYHLGGGREEPDGSTSFLFRFIGREQGIAGELYLRVEEEKWRLDDLILEDPRDLSAGGDMYHYDFSPYERLF